MFCDGCGAAVQPGQEFCSKCGKRILGPVIATHAAPGRVRQHGHLLGILWLAISAFYLLGGLFLLVLSKSFIPHLHELPNAPHDLPTGFLSSFVCFVGILILLKGVCGFIAGWGLMRLEAWARVLALVLAFISLFNIPFGTAIGVYTMWVLLPGESQREYDTLSAANAA